MEHKIYLFCTHLLIYVQLTAVWADVDAVESQSELANILLEWAPHVTSKECYLTCSPESPVK